MIESCHWYARPIVYVVSTLFPSVFATEYRLFEELALLTSRGDYSAKVTFLEDFHRYSLSCFRRMLALRVSIGRLSRFSKLLA